MSVARVCLFYFLFIRLYHLPELFRQLQAVAMDVLQQFLTLLGEVEAHAAAVLDADAATDAATLLPRGDDLRGVGAGEPHLVGNLAGR